MLEDENAKLEKLLAKQMLAFAPIVSFSKKIIGPAATRGAASHLKGHNGVLERRAS
jgi:hypothetical protein